MSIKEINQLKLYYTLKYYKQWFRLLLLQKKNNANMPSLHYFNGLLSHLWHTSESKTAESSITTDVSAVLTYVLNLFNYFFLDIFMMFFILEGEIISWYILNPDVLWDLLIKFSYILALAKIVLLKILVLQFLNIRLKLLLSSEYSDYPKPSPRSARQLLSCL